MCVGDCRNCSRDVFYKNLIFLKIESSLGDMYAWLKSLASHSPRGLFPPFTSFTPRSNDGVGVAAV